MRRIVISFVGFMIVLAAPYVSKAEESSDKVSPIQIAICNPVQLVPDDWDVWGLRLNLPYGCNRHVVGVDLGLVNIVDTIKGVQVGLFNNSMGMEGIQIGFGNACIGASAGVQISGGMNYSLSFTGLQVGFWNKNKGGCQGVQMAFLNRSSDMKGVQIGIVNIADEMSGVQIGLANIIKDSPVPFLPIINAHF